MDTVVATKKLTDKEKDDLLKEVLGKDYAAAGNNLPILKGFIDKVGNIDNLFTISELLPIVNRILAVRVFSFMATGVSVVSIFLIPISAMIGSKRLILQAKTGMPRVDSKELIEYEKTWRKSSQDVVNKMNSVAINNNIPKEALQVFLRVIADNNEQKLCEILMKGFEKQFSFIELRVWKSNYNLRYPN